jgi:tetratricopeptide (TPR) repeat protein
MAMHTGDWDRARALYGQAQALHRQIDLAPRSCEVGSLLGALGHLRQLEGAADEAARYLDEAIAIFSFQGKRSGLRWTQSLRAEGEILAGRPSAARARLLSLLDRNGLQEYWVTTYVLPVLAWAHLECGDTDQAGQTLQEAIRRLRAAQCQLRLVDALRMQALLALRQHRWQEAAEALEEGLSLARGMPRPHAEGCLLQAWGVLHARKGEPASARERLEEALAIFQRLRALRDIAQTEQLLTTHG